MTIYQVFTRLFGNDKADCVPSGTKQQNGCGTMQAFTAKALEQIRSLGCTHIWFTGVIEHASKTDYSAYGIAVDNPDVVKGEAGSPGRAEGHHRLRTQSCRSPVPFRCQTGRCPRPRRRRRYIALLLARQQLLLSSGRTAPLGQHPAPQHLP